MPNFFNEDIERIDWGKELDYFVFGQPHPSTPKLAGVDLGAAMIAEQIKREFAAWANEVMRPPSRSSSTVGVEVEQHGVGLLVDGRRVAFVAQSEWDKLMADTGISVSIIDVRHNPRHNMSVVGETPWTIDWNVKGEKSIEADHLAHHRHDPTKRHNRRRRR